MVPLREETHQNRIRLACLQGETIQAKRYFEELRTLLQRELGTIPSLKTRAVLDETIPIVVQPPSNVLPIPAPPVWQANRTHFYGRETEQDLLQRLLAVGSCRIVTITGAGGIGKTRLLSETLRTLSPDTYHIVYVPLADTQLAERVPQAVAAALNLSVSGDSLEAALTTALNAVIPAPLLILDNLEQLLEIPESEPFTAFLQRLLHAVPRLQLLATSRRPLFLSGEQEVALPPLALPTLPGTPERLGEWASVRLFVDRAQSRRAQFLISTTAEAEAVAAICRHLDGIPLAIELAAAWADVLTPTQLLHRLQKDSDLLLTQRGGAATERHHSLAVALRSSLKLSPELLRTFVALSVFHGGWTLEAAEAVLATVPDCVTALAALRERSLLVAEAVPESAGLRYRYLEPIRELAREALVRDYAAERGTLQERHFVFYESLVAGLSYTPKESAASFARLEREIANLEAALHFALTEETAAPSLIARGIDLLGSLAWPLGMRGKRLPREQWLRGLWERREQFAHAPEVAARLYFSTTSYAINRAEKTVRLHRAQELFEQLGDTGKQAQVWEALGIFAGEEGDLEAMAAAMERALAIYAETGERAPYLWTMATYAGQYTRHGLFDQARPLLEMLRENGYATGDLSGAAKVEIALAQGYIHGTPRDLDCAEALLRSATQIFIQTHETWNHADAMKNLAATLRLAGRVAEARDAFLGALRLFQQMNDPGGIAAMEGELASLSIVSPVLLERASPV